MVVDFRRRWDSPEGVLLAAEVLARLKSARPLGDLGLGEIGGRVDLRGFPIPPPRPVSRDDITKARTGDLAHSAFIRKAEMTGLTGVSLRGLDLSGAILDGLTVRNCVVEDCVLDEVSGRELTFVQSRVLGVSLRGADLAEGGLGTLRAGRCGEYDRVDFTGADLRVGKVTAWFRDCDFSGARLDMVRFIRCGLVRCRFSGIVEDVLFRGGSADDGGGAPDRSESVDMRGAIFRNVGFRGFNVDGVALPDESGVRVVRDFPRVVRAALKITKGWQGEPAGFLRYWLTDQLRGLDAGHPVSVVNRNDFVTWGGEGLADLAESVIAKAELEVARK